METDLSYEKIPCGYVALVGRPNVGKSTLLNRILGMKISIVSRKPQTTRHRILGVNTTEAGQIIYVDTPGIHGRAEKALNRYLNRAAGTALADVDVIVFVVECGKWTDDDQLVLDKVKAAGKPVILVANKIDKLHDKADALPVLDELSRRMDFHAVIPLSASRGFNVEALEREIVGLLPKGPALFPEEQVTDRSQQFLVAELVREQLMNALGQEVPYSATVEVEEFTVEQGLTRIGALIWVERPSQKAIIIGRGGERLKLIGQRARREIETMVGQKVFLRLWVKVRQGWADDERALRSLGFDES